jgi:hypothetical protein
MTVIGASCYCAIREKRREYQLKECKQHAGSELIRLCRIDTPAHLLLRTRRKLSGNTTHAAQPAAGGGDFRHPPGSRPQ